MRATNNLSAVAGNNLITTRLIEASNRLDLLAGDDLINTAGGIIKGRDVSLTLIISLAASEPFEIVDIFSFVRS